MNILFCYKKDVDNLQLFHLSGCGAVEDFLEFLPRKSSPSRGEIPRKFSTGELLHWGGIFGWGGGVEIPGTDGDKPSENLQCTFSSVLQCILASLSNSAVPTFVVRSMIFGCCLMPIADINASVIQER